MRCIPCEREKSKLPFLIDRAKQRAKQSGEYYAIIYDEEDKKYRITSESLAKQQGEKVLHLLSPY